MKNKKKLFFIVQVFCVFVAVCAEPLTLENAILEAIKNNPEIMMQFYAVSAAQHSFRAAKGGADLKISLSGNYSNTALPVVAEDAENSSATVWGNAYPGSIFRIDTDTLQGDLAFEKNFVFGLQTKLAFSLVRTINENKISPDALDYRNAYEDYLLEVPDEYTSTDGYARSYGEVKFTATLPLLKSFKSSLLKNDITSAKEYLFQQQLELENNIAKKMQEVSSLYWGCVASLNELSQIEDTVKNLEARRVNLISLLDVGLVSRSEMTLLDSNIAKQKIELIIAEQQVIESKSVLAAAIGIAVSDEWTVSANIDFELDNIQTPLFNEEEKQHFIISAENNNIGIKIKLSELNRAKLAWEKIKIETRPDFDVFFSVGHKGAEYSDDLKNTFQSFVKNVTHLDYSGGFVFSCFLPNRNSGAADAAYQEYLKEQLAFDSAKASLQRDILSAFSAVEKYTEIIRKSRQVVNMYKIIASGDRERFDAGLITVDTLYTTEETNRKVQNAYIDSVRSYTIAMLKLKYLTGMLSGKCDDESSFSGKTLYLLNNCVSEK